MMPKVQVFWGMDSEHLQVIVDDCELSFSMWNYKLVCIPWDCWVFELCPSSGILKKTEKVTAGVGNTINWPMWHY
jgi:hypothetical protein